jgi:hypothetical protein
MKKQDKKKKKKKKKKRFIDNMTDLLLLGNRKKGTNSRKDGQTRESGRASDGRLQKTKDGTFVTFYHDLAFILLLWLLYRAPI